MGDKVGSGIGLSYRPVSLCSLAGRYDNDNPMPESTLFPQAGTKNLATATATATDLRSLVQSV
jgi:hypothetical protein